MRRSGLVVAVLTLAGCGALRDAFSAHPEVAGTAAGQTLTVGRLAELAGRAKKVPLRPEAVTGLTTVYLDRSEEHTLNSSHLVISYAVFCLKKKKNSK